MKKYALFLLGLSAANASAIFVQPESKISATFGQSSHIQEASVQDPLKNLKEKMEYWVERNVEVQKKDFRNNFIKKYML